jgi:hypothetical protein
MRIHLLPMLIAGLSCAREKPPATLSDVGSVARADTSFTWDSIPGRGFTLYVTRGSYAAARAELYRLQIDSSITNGLRLLGEREYAPHMRVFLVSSRAEVERIGGAGVNGFADTPSNSLVLVKRAECPFGIRHETMHLVSLRLWGQPLGQDADPYGPSYNRTAFEHGAWLREGLAARAEDRYASYSYRGLAAQWQAEGTLLPLDSLVRSFFMQDDLAAYIQSSTVIEYLLDKYGTAKFHGLWQVGADGFERIYRKTGAELEAEWKAWLRLTPAASRPVSIAAAKAEDTCPKRGSR